MEKTYKSKKKIACITLDFEKDYGDRIGEFNILSNKKEITELAQFLQELQIPLSLFITTNVLEKYPSSFEVAKSIGKDFHSHSHTHNTKNPDSVFEIEKSKKVFSKYFNTNPLGYRAPQGVLKNGDIEELCKKGYKFSSSLFPSFRPGKYNNLFSPINPIIYTNGFIEIPFSVIKKIRYTFSLSYIKLLGFQVSRLLVKIFGLPNIVVFDSHLHDFITNEKSFHSLPLHIKFAYSIRRDKGEQYLLNVVKLLKSMGYEFLTITELYEEINSNL